MEPIEKIQRINENYVKDNTVQLMLPYQDYILLFDKNGLNLHAVKDEVLVNKYLTDERRHNFPYSNIPSHIEKKSRRIPYTNIPSKTPNSRMKSKVYMVNQLFDLKKTYIRIFDKMIVENYGIKDGNEALMTYSILPFNETEKIMSYDEVIELISKKNNNNEEKYYIDLDGTTIEESEMIFTKDEIRDYIESKLLKNIEAFRRYEENNPYREVSTYLRKNPLFLNYMEHSVNNLDLEGMEYNIDLTGNVIVLTLGDTIKVELIRVVFIKDNTFKVEIIDYPVTKYTLEHLKNISDVRLSKEPKISLRLNKNIRREDITEAKK